MMRSDVQQFVQMLWIQHCSKISHDVTSCTGTAFGLILWCWTPLAIFWKWTACSFQKCNGVTVSNYMQPYVSSSSSSSAILSTVSLNPPTS